MLTVRNVYIVNYFVKTLGAKDPIYFEFSELNYYLADTIQIEVSQEIQAFCSQVRQSGENVLLVIRLWILPHARLGEAQRKCLDPNKR